MIPDINDALLTLCPNSLWSHNGTYESIIWYSDDTMPNKQEVEKMLSKLISEYKNCEYQQKRAIAYPSIQDQLDILYHEGYDAWKKVIKEVKDKYPKPE